MPRKAWSTIETANQTPGRGPLNSMASEKAAPASPTLHCCSGKPAFFMISTRRTTSFPTSTCIASLPRRSGFGAGSRERMPLWRAAARYAEERRSVVVLTGERYGMGSSRDWAAKGVALLGVRSVLALGFERIRRSNLIGIGILPLRLPADRRPQDLDLLTDDIVEIAASQEVTKPRASVDVRVLRQGVELFTFASTAAIETNLECEMLRAGGILPLILRRAQLYPS